jgi:hypothetical protein
VSVLQFISSFRWPVVIVGLAIVFRAQVNHVLKNLAERVTSVQAFGARVKLSELKRELESALPKEDTASGELTFSGNLDAKLIPGEETTSQQKEVQRVVELAARMGWTLAKTGMLTEYTPPQVSWDDQGRPGIEIPVEPGDRFIPSQISQTRRQWRLPQRRGSSSWVPPPPPEPPSAASTDEEG